MLSYLGSNDKKKSLYMFSTDAMFFEYFCILGFDQIQDVKAGPENLYRVQIAYLGEDPSNQW
jgi:hypothetical protein